LEKDKLE